MISFDPVTDPLRPALSGYGLRLADKHLFDDPAMPVLGPRFRIKSCELAYRLADANTLLILLYRRLDPASATIRNPFADLLWFLRLATEPVYGLQKVMGYVSTHRYHHENGLSERRLTQFYQRFFAARHEHYDSSLWLSQRADAVQRRLQQVPHKATVLQRPATPEETLSCQQ